MFGMLSKFHPMKYVGLATMAVGPWFLIYRYFFIRSSYNELVIGSLVFLFAGSFLWFLGGDEE